MKKALWITLLLGGLTAGALLGVSAADADTITDAVATLTEGQLTSTETVSAASIEPTLDNAKVLAIVVKLRAIRTNNGYGGIAASESVSIRQVKAVHRAMKAKLNSLQAVEIP